MIERLLGATAVVALALGVASMPVDISLATTVGARPRKASPAQPAPVYHIARNPFVLDSVAGHEPSSRSSADAGAHLVGIVLGSQPGAIFIGKDGSATTLGVNDHVGTLTITSISIAGVALSDGTVLRVDPDSASYGYSDQDPNAPIMPPVVPGLPTSSMPNLPAPRLPQPNAMPPEQSPDGATPLGATPADPTTPNPLPDVLRNPQ